MSVLRLSEADKRKFESRFIVTPGCWLWTGHIVWDGYGHFYANKKSLKAHRLSLFLYVGFDEKFHVLHSCDTPSCVNPDHLRPGTQAENVQDMMIRGRHVTHPVRGEEHGGSKITAAQAVAIRNDPRAGSLIAKEYGVSHSLVCAIKARKIWRHV